MNIQMQADVQGAKSYALNLLRTQLLPSYTYHCWRHTEEDVLPAVRRLARLSGLAPGDTQLLEVAAAFHDLGYVYQRQDHESVSIAMMKKVLPGYGFSAAQINQIASIINATRMPQTPAGPLEELMADADLDSLGRDDFIDTSRALWQEMNLYYKPRSWHEWLEVQLQFLQSHQYFSPAAHSLRDSGKARNIELIENFLAHLDFGQ